MAELEEDIVDESVLEEEKEEDPLDTLRKAARKENQHHPIDLSDARIARYIQGTRQGKYLTVEGLRSIDFSKLDPEANLEEATSKYFTKLGRGLVRFYIDEIYQHGYDSLAHLCLPTSDLSRLFFSKICYIYDLEEAIGTEKFQEYPRLEYNYSVDELVSRALSVRRITRAFCEWQQIPEETAS